MDQNASSRPADRARQRQQEGFGEQLPHDAAPAAADREADRDLAAADRTPRQEHVRDVEARDEQHVPASAISSAEPMASPPSVCGDVLVDIRGRACTISA